MFPRPLLKAPLSFLVLGLALSVLFSACSDANPPATSVGFHGGTPHRVGSPCDSGESQACSVTLSERGGVLECYHGTQACEDGRWGSCGNGLVTEQAALAPPAGVRALALSEAEGCVNNPCNPLCQWYDEDPEEPITAYADGSNRNDWDTGSLADLPGALVEQGLDQPCGTGRACQFNTRCENPPQDTCAHSVCETGIALTESCNECAAMVHEVAEANPAAYGQCFGAAAPDPSAEECVHDPCTTGLALKANCATQVALVCADSEYSACCSEVWDAACVERFQAVEPGICQCGPGEVLRNGECLFQIPATLSWPAARDTCRGHGDDWDLIWIGDASENAFVHDTWVSLPGETRWLGLTDQVAEGEWGWSSPELPGVWDEATASGMYANWCGPNGPDGAPDCPGSLTQPVSGPAESCARMNETGAWEAVDCVDTLAASVCKGPPTHAAIGGVPQCESAGEYFTNWGGYRTGDFHTVEHAFEPGNFQIAVVAAGEYAGGGWPDLRVFFGTTSLGVVTVTSVGWQTYVFDVTVDVAQSLPITVQFENDYYSGVGDDRNVFVDTIEIRCSGAPATSTWGSECVGIAETTCDISCNLGQPNNGSCVAWLPGETDPNCPDRADLSVGVPCDGTIPVCNHGQQMAPAGVTIVHFPESAGQFALPSPDLDSADLVTCSTTEEIAPGECVSVPESACSAPVTGTRHVMVNPPGADAIDECSGLDNWAIAVETASCDSPLCFGGSTSSTVVRRPVDIIFVIDNSSSMQQEIQAVEARINEDFAEIIESSGLDYRVIMVSLYGDVTQPFGSGGGGTLYPICVGPPLGGNACTDPANEVPAPSERFFHYSANVGSNNALCLLLDGFSAPDELAVADRAGWQVQAPNGFGAWLRPEAFKTFVVITDDNVECTTASNITFDDGETAAAGTTVANDFDVALRTLAPGQFENETGARDYIWHSIINVPENTPADTPWPPDAAISLSLCSGPPGSYVGPGTGYQALSRLTGGLRYPSCRTSDFDAVFSAIAQEVIGRSELTCSFGVDSPDADLDAARVAYTTGDDDHVALEQVADADSCASGGWYMDSSGDVPTVDLCPSTCQEIQGDPAAQLFVEFACEVSLDVVTETQIYEATCPAGTIVEWKALGYDTTIEDNGSVEFSIRTAVTQEELPSGTDHVVNVATASNPDCVYLEPMACVADDTACNCVEVQGQPEGIGGGVVLDGEVLDSLESHHQYLELTITVTPDLVEMTSPTVEAWKVAYSCLPGE